MNNKKAKLKVNGIHCNGCASKIKNSLETLNRDIEADVNITTGDVVVSFDGDKFNLSDIKSKIVAVGFQIESVELG